VIGAHYDHDGKEVDAYNNVRNIYFGADDNASGTAGILEIAQKLSLNKSLLKRSVLVVFFGAEEGGLHGSRFFIQSAAADKYRINAMVNLDMIGRMRDSKLVIYGSGTMPYWITAISEFNKKYGFKIRFSGSDPGRSDQKTFIDRGIPAVHFFTDMHKDYHTVSDIADKIKIKESAEITGLAYDVIYDLCTNESLQLYDNSLPDVIDVTNSIILTDLTGSNTDKIYLGCTFDLFKSVNGLYVEGVTVNSPAEICGLKSGDKIIKIGNSPVKNVMDYAKIISEYSPYQKVKFHVMRGKKEIKIMVLFGYAE
ncbi:MAG: M20/M25/M40 family metallo-hydrolase, partial [Ignavibacteria bacterium]|nr:M20/M25/M40 family metallo-hydrolase [Ignavibacteria bacterium]